MGIFNNWILAKAEKITAKKKLLDAQDAERRKLAWQKTVDTKQKIFAQLNEYVQTQVEEFKKTPCDLKEGDEAILNIYCLGKDGYNGWDGGPNSLSGHMPEADRKNPIIIKVTSVVVDTSFANELIERFYTNHDTQVLETALENNMIVHYYTNWINNKRQSYRPIGDITGLYWTVNFDTDSSFKPKWGLNSNSFLAKGTPEFDLTLQIWSEEIELAKEQRRIQEELDTLTKRKKEIQEKYRNIKLNYVY